jgi:hypothetical protein
MDSTVVDRSDFVDGSGFVEETGFVENKRIKLTEKSESEALDELNCSPLEEELENVKRAKLLDCGSDYHRILEHMDFIDKYSFVTPPAIAIAEIKKFVGIDKVLEVGAGLGFWAKLLRLIDIDVLATDRSIYPTIYTFIEKIDGVEAVKKYKDKNVLMMIWPEDENWVDETLQNFTGNKMIFAGNHDCCATEKFYERCSNEWNNIKSIETPAWFDSNCDVKLYERK